MSANKKPIAYGGIIRGSLFETSNNSGEKYCYDEFFKSTEIDVESLETDIVSSPVSVKELYSVLEDA